VSPDSQNHNLIPITTRSTPGVTIFRPWYDWVRVAGAVVALLSSVVLAAMARPILLAVVMMGRNRTERRDLETRLERLERDHGLRF